MKTAVASCRLTVATLAALCLAHPLRAQELRGTVRDSATRDPIAGAVVILRDSAGRSVTQVLTSDRGHFRAVAPPEARRLRVVRIGYRPHDAPLGAALPLDIALTAIPVLLDPVRVAAAVNCPRHDDTDAAMALLAQARAGLLAVMVARRTNPPAVVRLAYQRRMDGLSERIVRQTVRRETESRAGESFEAVRTPAEFLRLGFVTHGLGTRFLGPDADILLDDTFAHGYCFRIAEPQRARPTQVGLSFVAAGRLPDRVDVEGTLWIDTVARALVDIEFRYRGLQAAIERHRPGGHISFRTMPNGLVLIDRWVLRLVGVEQLGQIYDNRSRRLIPSEWVFYSEAGGELARASWRDGPTWRGPLGLLRLTGLTDEGAPVAGAIMHLQDTDTDAAGELEIPDLVPGPYTLMIQEPRLNELNIELPAGVSFVAQRDSTTTVTFRVPTGESFTRRRCDADSRIRTGGRMVLGRATTTDGRPLAEVRVTANLDESGQPLQPLRVYITGSDGLFHFCLPVQPGATIAFDAVRGGGLPVRVVRTLADSLTIVSIPVP